MPGSTEFSEYGQYDALGLAELVRKREVTAAELLDSALAQAARYNPAVNAIVTPMHEQAQQQIAAGLPDGLFSGVPFLIKDLLSDVAGLPTSGGARFLKDTPMPVEAEIVSRMKRAGLVIFGKTNTPELGLLPVTESELWGPARNPWNLDHTTGGSSGGAGAAVATRMVPMAGGGDGGGSIRIPAACCGLVGLKPTRGRNPSGPLRSDVWFGAVAEHPLTRSVRDCAAALDALAGPEPGSPHFAPPPSQSFLTMAAQAPGKLRIAWTGEPLIGRSMHPDCLRGLEATVTLLESLGHECVEAKPTIDREAFLQAFMLMLVTETASDLAEAQAFVGRRIRHGDFEPDTLALAKLGHAYRAHEMSAAMRHLRAVSRDIGQFMVDYDVLLTPTLSGPALPVGALKTRGVDALGVWLLNHLPIAGLAKRTPILLQTAEKILDFIPNPPVFNVTGQPSISLPLHHSADGLPIGMMFTGRFADEATLLRLASQLEQARPWADQRPPLILPS